MMPLHFSQEREESTASWQRADPTEALFQRLEWDKWLVYLPDGDDVHIVTLHRDHGVAVGECIVAESRERCPARRYNDLDKPCAHLCAAKRAADSNVNDTQGQTVKIFSLQEVGRTTTDEKVEAAMADETKPAMADGGPEVSQ